MRYQVLVVSVDRANGIVASARTTKPAIATQRPPIESVRRPASVRDISAPTPWGASRSPALRASSPRTCCQYSGSNSMEP